MIFRALLLLACLAVGVQSHGQGDGGSAEAQDAVDHSPATVPDLREDELRLKLQKRDLVIVPIPNSNPTLETGLALAGAYFYPQSEAQRKSQPPSVTGAVAYGSSNDSTAFAVAHQSYLKEDSWRLGGVIGHADLNLELGEPATGSTIDWLINGDFFGATVSRKISGNWYAGVFARYLSMSQSFGFAAPSAGFNTESDAKTAGLGVKVEFDGRDKPFNSYSGRAFKFSVLFNGRNFGGDDAYESYDLRFRSYHSLSPKFVLAWEARACNKSGEIPLWDACRIGLRGFSTTDYLGRFSASGQAEARWRFHRKWGAVAFAGGGYYKNSFSGLRERELIPGYGAGLRFMVLESQRINVRLDYARSRGSDAIYLSVGEAF